MWFSKKDGTKKGAKKNNKPASSAHKNTLVPIDMRKNLKRSARHGVSGIDGRLL